MPSKPQSATDLAQSVLDQVSSSGAASEVDEVTASDQLADTLASLQAVIERNAMELQRINKTLHEKRESLESVLDNDTNLAAAQEALQKQTQEVKQQKSSVMSSPQVVAIKNDIAEMTEQRKEVEETLNTHLLNYYSLTHSTSFDTSDGDQWDFSVTAKLKRKH